MNPYLIWYEAPDDNGVILQHDLTSMARSFEQAIESFHWATRLEPGWIKAIYQHPNKDLTAWLRSTNDFINQQAIIEWKLKQTP